MSAGQAAGTWVAVSGRRFLVRPLAPDGHDCAAVLALFERVFGHRGTAQWHTWKYIQGDARAVGLWSEDGQLLAHYGGVPRVLQAATGVLHAVQIGDVMVAPEVRGLLTRRGPFFQVCSRFFGDWVGTGRDFALAFGFPNARHMKLGRVMDLYHDVLPVMGVHWPSGSPPLPFGWRCEKVDGDAACALADRLWPAMRAGQAGLTLGVRDGAYLRWRFVQRPDMEYAFLALRRWPWQAAHAARALAVVRIDEAAGSLQVLDVIGGAAAMPAMLRAVRQEAARRGLQAQAWACGQSLQWMCAHGAVQDGPVASLAVARASALDAAMLADMRWWWTGGDTDFL